MDIRSILVHVDIDSHTPDFFRSVGALAERFHAKIIGHTAASPSAAYAGYDGGMANADLYVQEREEIEKRLIDIAAEFRASMPSGVAVEWQSMCSSPNLSLNDHVYRADLIVAQSVHGDWEGASRHLDLGDLVLSAGRPLLLMGSSASEVKAERIVVGWKDSREARRAISDALPFLQSAKQVWVTSVDESNSNTSSFYLEGVVQWLGLHGVKAEGRSESDHHDAAGVLIDLAGREEADLIVTGGYGHSRMREWLFGGVTRDLLGNTKINRLMSN